MGSDEQSDINAEDAEGTSGRTGQSLGELTEQRGDPSGKKLDLDEPTTAPLHDSTLGGNVGGEDNTARTSTTSPEETEHLSEVAQGADSGEK